MQRYFGTKCENDILYLENSDYHHIKNVMRMSDGQKVEVVIDSNLYLGCIENVNEKPLIRFLEKLETKDEYIPKVNLIIPPLKEAKMDLILQKATEMGVFKITICPMKRCVVKLDSKKLNSKQDRWQRILKEASEQSFRIKIPALEVVSGIDKLPNLSGLMITCSTKELKNNVKRVLTNNKKCDTINVVIGPEGGLDDSEEAVLSTYGFISTTLGSRIMRVESVPLFILSVINYEYME